MKLHKKAGIRITFFFFILLLASSFFFVLADDGSSDLLWIPVELNASHNLTGNWSVNYTNITSVDGVFLVEINETLSSNGSLNSLPELINESNATSKQPTEGSSNQTADTVISIPENHSVDVPGNGSEHTTINESNPENSTNRTTDETDIEIIDFNTTEFNKTEPNEISPSRVNQSVSFYDTTGLLLEYDYEEIAGGVRYYIDTIIDEIIIMGEASGALIFSELDSEGYERMYLFDSSSIIYNNASFSTTAQGDELYSCVQWQEEVCSSWEFVQQLTPQVNYELPLFPGVTTYGERKSVSLGISGTIGSQAVFNATHADGMVVYGQSTINNPYYQLWDDALNFGAEQTNIPDVGGDTKWAVLEPAPTRDELLLGVIQDGKEIHGLRYNGSAWNSDFTISTVISNSAFRSFDIAYEQISGDALVVYENDGTNGNAVFAYRTWNGTNFSAEQTYDTGMVTASFDWFEIVPKKGTDDIMVMALTSSNDLYGILWNGTDLDSSFGTTLTTSGSSSTEPHFDFGWEGSSGQGLAVYAASDLTYRTFDPVGGWGGTETTINVNAVDVVSVCGDDTVDDYIGFIWQDSGNDVQVRMWDGSSVLASEPSEDVTTEANGGNNKNVDCAWYNATHALFAFPDVNTLAVNYLTFQKTNTWSSSDLTSVSASSDFASDDIKSLHFTSHPTTAEIMVLAQDISNDLSAIRWDGSAFQTIAASPLETSMEVGSGAQQAASFAYYQYDAVPAMTNLNPSGVSFLESTVLLVNVSVSDNIAVDTVVVNVTLPNTSIRQVTLVNGSLNNTFWNGTFAITDLDGLYSILAQSNDTSNNINTLNTTFTISDNAPRVNFSVPVTTSNYSIRSSNQTFNGTIFDLNIDNIIYMFTNGTGNDFNRSASNQSGYWTIQYNVSQLTEGAHTVTMFANDTDANVNQSQSVTLTTDFTNPSVNFTTPVTGSTYLRTSSNQTFNMTVFETNYVHTVYFSFDNASGTDFNVTSTNLSGYWQASYNVSTLAEGVHVVRVFANDTVGNSNTTETVQLTVDFTAPLVSIIAPTAGSNFSVTSFNQTFNASIQDLLIDVVYFMFDNATGNPFNITASNQSGYWTTQYNVSGLVEGLHTLTMFANDTQVATNNTVQQTFNVDLTIPAVTWNTPATTTNVSLRTGNLTLNATVTDLTADTVIFMFNNGTGNDFNVTPTNTSGYWTASYNFSSLSEAAHTVTVFANDSVKGTNRTESISLTMDFTPPFVNFTSPSASAEFSASSNNQTFNATVFETYFVTALLYSFDNASGTSFNISATNFSGYWQASYNVSTLDEGKHLVSIFANDSAGNINTTERLRFTVDSLPPNVTALRPVNGSVYNHSMRIELGANITDVTYINQVLANVTYPNATNILLTLGNGSGYAAKFNISFILPKFTGLVNVTFIVNDTSGNKNGSERVFFTVNDGTAPNVTWISPLAGSTHLQNANITLNVTISDEIAVSTVVANFTVPNGSVFEKTLIDSNSDGSYNVTFSDTNTVGTYNISITTNDTANNVNETESRTFVIQDVDAPLVTLVVPPTDSVQSSTVTFTCNATDTSGLANISFYHNISGDFVVNQTNLTINGTTNKSSFLLSSIADGSFVWNCLAYDTSGNNAFAGTNFSFKFDSTAPLIADTQPVNVSSANVASILQIAANVSDVLGVSTVRANLTYPNGSASLHTLSLVTGTKYNTSFIVPDVIGSYNITFVANDTSNNINATVLVFFTGTDVLPPNVTELLPTNGSAYNLSNSFYIGVNVTDDVGIDTVLANVSYPNGSYLVYTLNNGSGFPQKFNISFTAPEQIGEYNVTFIGNDTSDNLNSTRRVFFTIADVNAPNVTNPQPTNGSTTNVGILLEISVNVTDDLIADSVFANVSYPNGSIIIYTLNNGTGYAGKYNISWSVPELLGNYNISFTANDTGNNRNTSTFVSFNVTDNTVPNVTADSPVGRQNYEINARVEFSANVTDNLFVDTVNANVSYPNGSNIVYALANGTNFAVTYNTSILAPAVLGSYNITYLANDTSNNRNDTIFRFFSVNDTTAPTLSLASCIPTSINLSQTIVCNITAADALFVDSVTVNVSYPNSSVFTQTVSNFSANYTFSFSDTTNLIGTYTVNWGANDTSNNRNNLTSSFNISDVTSPQVNLSTPLNLSNSSSSVTFNFSVSENYYLTELNCSLYINNTLNITNASVRNATPALMVPSGFVQGHYAWNISCTDNSSNTNVSELRVLRIDTTPPDFNSLTTNPGVAALLDPGTNITALANITDNVTPVDVVTLQYKLSNDSTYNNLSMFFDTGTLLYNGSFVAGRNGTYNLRLWANDSLGENGFSKTLNIGVFTDLTWNVSPRTITPVAVDSNVNISLTNLTINNSGDVHLNFTLTNLTSNPSYNSSTSFVLLPNQVRFINVNETAPTGGVKTVKINVSVNDTFASRAQLVTGTIVVAPGQPVLVVTITTPNSDSRTVTQGDNAVAFAASVTNVGAGNATNVTMFFSIEDEWNLTFGTLNISVDELNSGDTEVNTIEVSIPNTAPTGTFTVIANVTGKNSSTGTLLDPYNLTFEDTVSVLVESKTSTLGSAIESTGSSSSSSSGGGGVTTSGGGGGSSGGGGGSTIPTETVSSSETVRILRGTADSFPITITNLEPGTRLINVRIELDGFATQFLSVTPDSLSDIDFETSEDFLVNIEVPEYFTDEEYLLSATITGTYVSLDNSIAFTQKKLTEFRTIVLQVGKVEEEEIVVNFQLSQDFVQEMQEAGFPTFEVEDLFAQAEDAFEAGDLEKAQQLLDEISVSHETAFAANALLLQLEQDFLSAENDWLDVIEARETYELALAAFARGDFTTALERAKNAQLIFVLETRGRVNVFKFILDWWWLVLITLAISSLALYVAYKKILIFIIVQRMKYLNKEEQTIHDLLRDTQAEYLQTGTISEQQYHSFVDQYTERLTKIQQERIKLRSKRVALQKSNYEVKSLKKEQLGIHKLAKKDQINYFVKGSLTRARFIGRRDLNQERLMEIEREKTQVQEKKRNKKQGFFSMLLNVLHRISPLVLGKPKKSRKKSSRKLILQKGKTIFLVFILFFIGVAMLLSQYFNSSRELHFLSWALNLIPLLSSSLVSHLLNLGSALGDFFFSVFNTLWKRLFFFTLIFILSAGYVILFSRALRKNLKKILGVLVVVLAIIVLAYQPGVTGAFSLVNVAPQGFSYSIEEEATEGEAMAALTKAEVTILRIAELNVSTRFAEDLYSEAQLAYESGNYTHTIVAMLVVDYLHQDILELIDQVAIYKIQYAETKDFDLTEAYIKLQEAEEALALARHDEARELLEQSYTAFVVASEEKSRVENLVQLSRSFFVRYWWQILLAVAAISISLVPIMKRVRKKIIARKLKDLRLELVHTKSMIKKLQNDCFIRKKITPMQYKAAAKKYSHRIGELKHIIPAMENQLLERKRKRVLQKGVIEIK